MFTAELREKAKQLPRIKLFYDGSCTHFVGQPTRFVLSIGGILKGFFNVLMIAPKDKPDIIWVSSDKFHERLLEHDVPIMVEDMYQPPDILGNTRKILKHDQVKLLLKNSTTTSITPHNEKQYNHSIHQNLIAKTDPTLPPANSKIHGRLEEEDFAKVQAGWNYIAWPNFRSGSPHDRKPLREEYYDYLIPGNKRPYDVNFVGNIHKFAKGAELIRYHREKMWEEINKYPGTSYLEENNCIGWHKYWKILQQSKIVVSPWGWEPVTFRDIEAVLAGCILIKPDTTFVTTYPNIPHFRCKRDFSDLNEQITSILDRWDKLDEFRMEACQHLHTASETLPKRVYSMIAKTIGQTPPE